MTTSNNTTNSAVNTNSDKEQAMKELSDLIGETKAKEMAEAVKQMADKQFNPKKEITMTKEQIEKYNISIYAKLKSATILLKDAAMQSGEPVKAASIKGAAYTAIGVGKSEQFLGRGLVKAGEFLIANGEKVEGWGKTKLSDLSAEEAENVRLAMEAVGLKAE